MIKENQSELILIHIHTFGGRLVYADSIKTKFLNRTIPTIVFIDNNAVSAGVLIFIPCDKIYIQKWAPLELSE
jgi:membrane-bound serine protease (ClpP class)